MFVCRGAFSQAIGIRHRTRRGIQQSPIIPLRSLPPSPAPFPSLFFFLLVIEWRQRLGFGTGVGEFVGVVGVMPSVATLLVPARLAAMAAAFGAPEHFTFVMLIAVVTLGGVDKDGFEFGMKLAAHFDGIRRGGFRFGLVPKSGFDEMDGWV